MPEVAINLPLDAAEIKEIAVAEFKKRLDSLSPLQGMKEYARFELDFNVKIRLKYPGSSAAPAKETLAWGHVEKTDPNAPTIDLQTEQADVIDSFQSNESPNVERMERDMPLTIETTDGRGGKTRKKARVKAA